MKDINHIAIIMDGNGRWAKEHGLPRMKGHIEGAKVVQNMLAYIDELNKEMGIHIQYLTLFAFSTENWNRPSLEIQGLMKIFASLGKYIDAFNKNNVKVNVIGRKDKLPSDVQKTISKIILDTEKNTGGTLTLCINYGGRAEIIDGIKRFTQEVIEGKTNLDDLDEKSFHRYLYDATLPDPDLIIRTAGEFRISNFLLWEMAYSEVYISDKYWPDFDKQELQKAIESYTKRDRRFGRIGEE